MTKTFGQRWTTLVGIIAMLGVVISVPAITVAQVAPAMDSAASADHEMPCEKPCPDCPKSCADMAGCLVKCFQSVTPAAGAPEAIRFGFVEELWSSGLSVLGDRLIPPLLRPPSI